MVFKGFTTRGAIRKKEHIFLLVACVVCCQLCFMCGCCFYLFVFNDVMKFISDMVGDTSGTPYLKMDWRGMENGCHKLRSHEYYIAQPTRERRFEKLYRTRPFHMEIDLVYSPWDDIHILNHHYNHTEWDVCDIQYYHHCDFRMFEFDEYLSKYGNGISSLIIDLKSSLFFGHIKADMIEHMLKLISDVLDRHSLKERTLVSMYYISNVVARACLKYNLRYGYKLIKPMKKGLTMRDYIDKLKEYPMLEGFVRPVRPWTFYDLQYKDFEYANDNGIAIIPWDARQYKSSDPPAGALGYIVIDYNSETLHRSRKKWLFFARFSSYQWCYTRSRDRINENAEVVKEPNEVVDPFIELSWRVLKEIKRLNPKKLEEKY